MAIDYSRMTKEQIDLIDEYCKDNMKKLKQICHFVWGQKGLPSCYHDDLYCTQQLQEQRKDVYF